MPGEVATAPGTGTRECGKTCGTGTSVSPSPHASEFVRRNAADALATMTAQTDHAVPALTTLVGDESGQVCFDAAYGHG